jgi:H+/Na+-translocating ferredoxin:NAD+ oxidoreductase subunit B
MDGYEKLMDIHIRHPLGGGDGEVLLKILKILYTPDEASFLSSIGFDPVSLDEISNLTGLDVGATDGLLKELLRKWGVSFQKREETVLYHLHEPFPGLVMYPLMFYNKSERGAGESGRWEELRSLLEEYFRSGFGDENKKRQIAPIRVLPWGNVLPVGRGEIQSHYKVGELIRSARKVARGRCPYIGSIDEVSSKGRGEIPAGTTFLFDNAAEFTIDAGLATPVKREELFGGGGILDAVKKGVDREIVLITSRYAEGVEMLCCAGAESCIFLRGVGDSVLPGVSINSGFAVRVTAGDCNACGICKEVCPVNAIRIGNVARIDGDKCIGCGLCVHACPSGAMMLIKDRGVQVRLPRNLEELKKRGGRGE